MKNFDSNTFVVCKYFEVCMIFRQKLFFMAIYQYFIAFDVILKCCIFLQSGECTFRTGILLLLPISFALFVLPYPLVFWPSISGFIKYFRIWILSRLIFYCIKFRGPSLLFLSEMQETVRKNKRWKELWISVSKWSIFKILI